MIKHLSDLLRGRTKKPPAGRQKERKMKGLKYYVVYGEDGGTLYEVQSFEAKSQLKEWKDGGYQVKEITDNKADKLSKTYRLNRLYNGKITQSGGDEPYIPADQAVS